MIKRREYIEKLEHSVELGAEEGHKDADEILCDLLEELGYKDVIEAYDKVDKCYT